LNPPSDKQIAILEKYKVPIPATKEEATAVIGKIFAQQNGEKEQEQPVKPEPTQVLPERSESERTEECSHMIQILWDMAQKKAFAIFPPPQSTGATVMPTDDKERDRIILAEVLYKGLVECWNR